MSIALSTITAFSAAVASARSVDFAAYTLRDGSARSALISAAARGAAVRVRLERDPLDDAAGSLHRANADTVAALTAAGADAALSAPGEPVLHLKAAVVDGVAWLDDRNWAGNEHETILRDSDADDVGAIVAALRGQPGADGHVRTTKAGAVFAEAALIRDAGDTPLAVESESFGNGAVYAALLDRGRRGLPSRLLVAGREATQPGAAGDAERRRLAKLTALGIAVRTGDAGGADLDEKMAIAGASAWVGSANATYAHGSAGLQRDWGLATREPELVAGLRAAFEANWDAGAAFTGGPAAPP